MRAGVLVLIAVLGGCGRQNFNEDAAVGVVDVAIARCEMPPTACASPVVYECNNQCFVRCADTLSRPAAAAICQGWGGCLAQIATAADNNCAASHLEARSWIDAQQSNEALEPSAGWKTCRANPIPYQNWKLGQPDDNAGGENSEEQCADLDQSTNWGDWDCALEKPFVCSRPL